jgi:hypothetical protein
MHTAPALFWCPHTTMCVRTLLVIRVRYQARSEVRTLLVFNTEFNHKRKDSCVLIPLYICVLIPLCICVLILLHMYPHTAICILILLYIILILVHMCPHTTTSEWIGIHACKKQAPKLDILARRVRYVSTCLYMRVRTTGGLRPLLHWFCNY